MDLNQVNLIGRLTNDPELKKLDSGQTVASFSLATNKRWKDTKSGEQKKSSQFHKIKAWGKLAEIVGTYLKKGDLIYVGGEIEYNQWEDKEGQKRYYTDIIMKNLKMLGGKAKESEEERAEKTEIVEEGAPF